ncbi:hypothetical protein ACFY6U_48990 [Streptomyces sp. NPDC013157]|uniref:hypothetical protein n=1 Tax=Streptomyces sp. NPDC013157 TaxID=3364861 RepID=UPI00367E395D
MPDWAPTGERYRSAPHLTPDGSWAAFAAESGARPSSCRTTGSHPDTARKWLLTHAEELGIDPRWAVVGGESTGG